MHPLNRTDTSTYCFMQLIRGNRKETEQHYEAWSKALWLWALIHHLNIYY